MTVEEKVEILRGIFRQNSNKDVLTWGEVPGGYRWTCASHAAAMHLAELLLSNVELLKLPRSMFPYRFEPDGGAMLIIEPIPDVADRASMRS